ncbi:hypothetical protein ACQJBY_061320 [Aegilops geniculata]
MGSCASVHKEDVGLPKKLSLALSLTSKVDLKRKIEVFGPSSRSVDSASLVRGSMDSLQKKLGSTMDGKTHHLLPWSDHGQEDVVRTRSPVLSGKLVLGRSSTPSFLLSPMIFRYTLGHYHMPCIQFEASRSHDIDGIHQSWILRHLDGP